MASNKLFQRYLWLVDTMYSAGSITRDEIDRRWAHSAYNDAHESQYGEPNGIAQWPSYLLYMSQRFIYLLFPIYPTQASWQLGAHSFVMGDTSATMAMARAVFRTGAIDVVVWAVHNTFVKKPVKKQSGYRNFF